MACLKNTTQEHYHRCYPIYAIVRFVLLFKPPSDLILVDGICLASTRCKMAVNQHCALLLLIFLVPKSFLLGCVVAICMLMVLVPLRSLWYRYCHIPMRCKSTVRLSKEQQRRRRQRHQRALWLRNRRERQRFQRVIWKMTRGLCESLDGVSTVAGTHGYDEAINPMKKASIRKAEFSNAVKSEHRVSSNQEHHISSMNQYSTPCAQSTLRFDDDQRIFKPDSMPGAKCTHVFDDCIDGDAEAIVVSGYSQASEQQSREASTAIFGGEFLCDPLPTLHSQSMLQQVANTFDISKLGSRGGGLDGALTLPSCL